MISRSLEPSFIRMHCSFLATDGHTMYSESAAAAADNTNSTTTATATTDVLHFVLIPLMAQGHMIPMLDLARLLASRNHLITFITTPINFARIRPIADLSAASNLPIRFIQLPFPVTTAGLPNNCENIDLVTSVDHFLPFLNALQLLRQPLSDYLHHRRSPDSDHEHWPRPACIISDNLHYWTESIAKDLAIPRLIFHGPSCFYLLCTLLIDRHKSDLESGSVDTIPGLPQPIRVKKHEINNDRHSSPAWSEILNTIREAEDAADGVLVNSFADLEPWYLERYGEEIRAPVWTIGPLCLYNKEESNEAKAARGRVSSIDTTVLFRWLDGQEVGSVVFVSFGSIARNTAGQLMELGYGLERSGRAFLWVVKEVAEPEPGGMLEEWMGELERRVDGRGLVIRGWAPQALILGHVAIGAFVTHCGWNSVLESVTAGVVMGTWPHFADQFLNERFVVDVLGIGVAVDGIDEPTIVVGPISNEGDDGVMATKEVIKVRRENVERVIEELMGGGEEAEKRRRIVKEFAEKARKAMEGGGSSSEALNHVIDYLRACHKADGRGK